MMPRFVFAGMAIVASEKPVSVSRSAGERSRCPRLYVTAIHFVAVVVPSGHSMSESGSLCLLARQTRYDQLQSVRS